MPAYGRVTSPSAEMPPDTDMLRPREKVCHLALKHCLLYNCIHNEDVCAEGLFPASVLYVHLQDFAL